MIKKIARKLNRIWKIYFLRDRQLLAVRKWFNDNGDSSLRYDYPLTPDAVVFDVGGYKGEWADNIYKRFHCNVYVFEPVVQFHSFIKENNKKNPKVKAFTFGLGGKNEILTFNETDDASSAFNINQSKKVIECEVRDIAAFIEENKIKSINLIKINIEGGEYALLDRMIEKNIIADCENIQVQFHLINREAIAHRERIRQELSKTHKLTYDYYFVWENWERKK